MLILAATTDKIEAVTSTAATLDVHVSYADLSGGVVTPDKKNTAISSATTTDISGSPASSTVRNLKALNIRNKDGALASDVTIRFNQNATTFELYKTTLLPGEVIQWVEGVGFQKLSPYAQLLINESTANQGAGFSSDTYLTGSNITIPGGLPVVGTVYRLWVDVAKTNVGTGAPTFTVRVGTAGTTADTARVTFTFGGGTAAADVGVMEAICVFRTVGSGTSAVLEGSARFVTNLATTGLSNAVKALQVTSGGFDSTVANSIIGCSYSGGASASHTVQQVRAELIA